MTGRRAIAAVLLAAGVLGTALPPAANAQAAPYVPLDDPAYGYVNALMARGKLTSLSAIERPYPADALATAAADTAALGPVARGWARALAARARLYLATASGSGFGGAIALEPAVTAVSSSRREPMLPDRDAALRPALSARAAIALGPVVAVGRLRADAVLRDDPEYTGRAEGTLPHRMEEGYLAARWRLAEVAIGRTSRDWGPPGIGGLQLSGSPYSFDHLYGRIGNERLRLQTLAARLDDGPGLYAPVVRRYLTMHRLAGRWKGLEWAATESYVYSGAGRRVSLALSNPLIPALATHYLNDETGNVSAALDLLWRSGHGILAVQAMLDDYQFESGNPGDDEPPSYALSMLAEGLPLWREHRAFASYTRVTNLTYRTVDPGDLYMVRGVSMGRALSDHDELRVGAELAFGPLFPIRVYAAHRRQGSGDYRTPFPAMEDYARTPTFLSGDVARITRLAVAGRGSLGAAIGMEADIGYDRVREPHPVPAPAGRLTTLEGGPSGTVRLTWTPSWLRARR